MSDWNEVLDARRAGEIEGFHGADQPLEDVPADEAPDVPGAPQPPAKSARKRPTKRAAK